MAGRAAGRGRPGVSAAGESDGAVGSGRGRGRGSSPKVTPRAPTTLADVISEIQEMRSYGDQPLPSSLLHKCVSFTSGSGTEEQLAQAIFDAVYDNRDRAEPMAILSSQLSSSENNGIGISFRSVILGRFQSQYKQRKELRQQSIEVWLSMVSFLSFYFKHMKCGGEPLKVLAVPLATCFSEILSLDDVDDNEIDCACELIRGIGLDLSRLAPEKDIEVAKLLRERMLATHTSKRAQCMLMEIIELRATGWREKEDAKRFYTDALADML